MRKTNTFSCFSSLKYFVIFVACFECVIAESDHANIYAFDFEKIKNNLFSNGQMSEAAANFTEFGGCLNELSAIKNGLNNVEEWALKLLDAWGKMPSEILSGNMVDFGGFSQCFHIERNDQIYDTQYCIGQLTFNSEQLTRIMEKNLFIKRHSVFPNVEVPEPGFSFGICLPAACSPEHFGIILNEVASTNLNGASVKILSDICQKEEAPSEFDTIDLCVIYVLTLLLVLIVASTGYDIFCTLCNRNKLQQFIAFSFYTNGRKLFSCRKTESLDTVDCLHGIRALSSLWIVFAHNYIQYTMFPTRNTDTVISIVSDYSSVIISSGPIAVDTFLTLSGFLVSLNILRSYERNGKISLSRLYLRRYIRLTPVLVVVVLVSMTLMRFLGNGPLWTFWNDFYSKPCKSYWWSTMLYVQNYVNPSHFCLLQTWSLSVDMQLFLVSPFLVYFVWRYKTKAVIALVGLVLGCMWITVLVHTNYGLRSMREEGKFQTCYYPTHFRFSSWLVGFIGGYFFFDSQKKSFRIPKIINSIGWALSLLFMLAVLLVNYPLQRLDTTALPIHYGLYEALSRVAWSIGMCYIIFACAHGSGGFVNWYLSHPYWQPISRLCYSTYLLHFPIILVLSASIKQSVYFSRFKSVLDFIGVYSLTFIVSTIVTLAVESPVLTIDKMIFKSSMETQSSKTSVNENSKQKVK